MSFTPNSAGKICESEIGKTSSCSFPLLKKFTIELLKKGEADKRTFHFCIKRLEVLAHCAEFDVPAAYFFNKLRLW